MTLWFFISENLTYFYKTKNVINKIKDFIYKCYLKKHG